MIDAKHWHDVKPEESPLGRRQVVPTKEEENPLSTLAELKLKYRLAAEQIPASLGGYAAMSQEDRDRIRDECCELNMQIFDKYHESRWLTWFGVDLK